jgi:hypothetical protein
MNSIHAIALNFPGQLSLLCFYILSITVLYPFHDPGGTQMSLLSCLTSFPRVHYDQLFVLIRGGCRRTDGRRTDHGVTVDGQTVFSLQHCRF